MQTETTTEIATQSFDEIAFGSFSDLRRLCRIPRSSAYGLLESGEIKSRYVGGKRYIDFESVRQFFAKAPQQPSKKLCREMKKRARSSAKKRREAKAKREAEAQQGAADNGSTG